MKPSTGRPTSDSVRLRTLYPVVRARTESLCEPLALEDCVVQSMPDASPTKWHLAHTSWFFETFVLKRAVASYREFHPGYALFFNSYYHAAGERHPRPERGLLSRPTLAEVRRYRAHVDGWMGALLAGEHGALSAELAFAIELGMNHEEQHQELLLTDVKHLLWCNPLLPTYRERAPDTRPAAATRSEWISFDGGPIEIGTDSPIFAFDNERPRHRRWVEPFELARRPVSCGEYLEFMAAGGYEQFQHWLSDGWDVCQRERWCAPLFWRRDGQTWLAQTLNGVRLVYPAEPVCHVSYFEADAYARWRGVRLPSEEEWEHAAEGEELAGNLLDTDQLHPAPCMRPGKRIDQLFGDVWEWAASAYTPYPGFRPFADDLGEYNGKWMNNRFVLRGGSCVTPARHIRASYRNFFPPEARWQFSGLRLARSPKNS